MYAQLFKYWFHMQKLLFCMVWFLRGICKQCISRLYVYTIFKLSNPPASRCFLLPRSLPLQLSLHSWASAFRRNLLFCSMPNSCWWQARTLSCRIPAGSLSRIVQTAKSMPDLNMRRRCRSYANGLQIRDQPSSSYFEQKNFHFLILPFDIFSLVTVFPF